MTRTVGLSGSLIPWKHQKSIYAAQLKKQAQRLSSLQVAPTDFSIIVFPGINTKLIKTLTSINKQSIQPVKVILVDVETPKKVSELRASYALVQVSAVTELNKVIEDMPHLLLNAGDTLPQGN